MVRPGGPQKLTEEQLDRMAGLTLIGGSALSFIIMVIGFFVLGPGPFPSVSVAQPPREVLAGVGQFDPLALLNLGILVLMATPVLRVIVAILGFSLEQRWRFVGVSCVVLTMLMISFFVASR